MAARTSTFENHFGFILSDISRLAHEEIDRWVRALGLTRAQWLVWLHLAWQPRRAWNAEGPRWPGSDAKGAVAAGSSGAITPRRDRLLGCMPRRGEPLIDRLAAVATELRAEYIRGLSPGRPNAVVAGLLQIKSNLLRMEESFRRRSHDEN